MAKTKKKRMRLWIAGARLRTLPLAVAPVALGSGAAASIQSFDALRAALALAVALFLQIGVNFANDYSDGIRGTDNDRVGPLRLTGSKSVRPQAVKFAAFAFFAAAAIAGLAIVLLTQDWWMLGVGALAILAAWFYTGGKSPYGYAGLGELAVFIFFGLVATIGTAYIQIDNWQGEWPLTGILTVVAASSIGLFAAAVLMVNNIRDIETDARSGKRTLAVKLGKTWAKALYLVMIWLPIGLITPFALLFPATFFAYAVVLLVAPITLIVLTARSPKEFILALKLTSYSALAYSLLLAWGWSVVAIAA
jgi:1,4-dihydroxy-2-naphthoate octaprenyltransferase